MKNLLLMCTLNNTLQSAIFWIINQQEFLLIQSEIISSISTILKHHANIKCWAKRPLISSQQQTNNSHTCALLPFELTRPKHEGQGETQHWPGQQHQSTRQLGVLIIRQQQHPITLWECKTFFFFKKKVCVWLLWIFPSSVSISIDMLVCVFFFIPFNDRKKMMSRGSTLMSRPPCCSRTMSTRTGSSFIHISNQCLWRPLTWATPWRQPHPRRSSWMWLQTWPPCSSHSHRKTKRFPWIFWRTSVSTSDQARWPLFLAHQVRFQHKQSSPIIPCRSCNLNSTI